MWADRRWEWAALRYENGDFYSTRDLDVDAREKWFYQAIAAPPAMFRRAPGAGSMYRLGHRDSKGRYLDGAGDLQALGPAAGAGPKLAGSRRSRAAAGSCPCGDYLAINRDGVERLAGQGGLEPKLRRLTSYSKKRWRKESVRLLPARRTRPSGSASQTVMPLVTDAIYLLAES